MRTQRYITSWVSALLVAGCGAGLAVDANGEPASMGDATAPPNLSALPTLPSLGELPTQRVNQALMVAQRVLDMHMPPPPKEHSFSELQHWIDTDVVKWLEQRNAGVDDTRYQFSLGDKPDVAEQVIAHAVLATVFENTADALAHLPVPSELASEPDIATMYGEVIAAQTKPLVSSVLVELKACADTGVDAERSVRVWARYCNERFQRLKKSAFGGNTHAVSARTAQ